MVVSGCKGYSFSQGPSTAVLVEEQIHFIVMLDNIRIGCNFTACLQVNLTDYARVTLSLSHHTKHGESF